MLEVKNLAERELLETSRKLSPELMIELVAYAEALANKDRNKINLIESMTTLSQEAKKNGLTEEILKDILEQKA